MSAFTVSRQHLDAIVAVAMHGPRDAAGHWSSPRWFEGNPRVIPAPEQITRCLEYRSVSPWVSEISPSDLGSMLWAENYASVNHRYGEHEEPPAYTFERPRRRLTAVETLKAIDCLDYQSCEHPAWIDSEASRFLDSLRRCIVGVLPGYAEAAWEADAPVTS